MKKLSLLIVSIFLVVGLVACGGKNNTQGAPTVAELFEKSAAAPGSKSLELKGKFNFDISDSDDSSADYSTAATFEIKGNNDPDPAHAQISINDTYVFVVKGKEAFLSGNGASVRFDESTVKEMDLNSYAHTHTKIKATKEEQADFSKFLKQQFENNQDFEVLPGSPVNGEDTWKVEYTLADFDFKEIFAEYKHLALSAVDMQVGASAEEKQVAKRELNKIQNSISDQDFEIIQDTAKQISVTNLFYSESGKFAGMSLSADFKGSDLDPKIISSEDLEIENSTEIKFDLEYTISYSESAASLDVPQNAPLLNSKDGMQALAEIFPALAPLLSMSGSIEGGFNLDGLHGSESP